MGAAATAGRSHEAVVDAAESGVVGDAEVPRHDVRNVAKAQKLQRIHVELLGLELACHGLGLRSR